MNDDHNHNIPTSELWKDLRPKTAKGWLWLVGILAVFAYLVVVNFGSDSKFRVIDCDKLRGAAYDVCWAKLEEEAKYWQEWDRTHYGR